MRSYDPKVTGHVTFTFDTREHNNDDLLIACVTLLPSCVTNLVGLTILAGPQVYPGPGAFKVKFFGTLTVLLVVPAAPTLS